MNAREWNERYPIGQRVLVRGRTAKTCSRAFSCSARAYVAVSRIGIVKLDECEPLHSVVEEFCLDMGGEG